SAGGVCCALAVRTANPNRRREKLFILPSHNVVKRKIAWLRIFVNLEMNKSTHLQCRAPSTAQKLSFRRAGALRSNDWIQEQVDKCRNGHLVQAWHVLQKPGKHFDMVAAKTR